MVHDKPGLAPERMSRHFALMSFAHMSLNRDYIGNGDVGLIGFDDFLGVQNFHLLMLPNT